MDTFGVDLPVDEGLTADMPTQEQASRVKGVGDCAKDQLWTTLMKP